MTTSLITSKAEINEIILCQQSIENSTVPNNNNNYQRVTKNLVILFIGVSFRFHCYSLPSFVALDYVPF